MAVTNRACRSVGVALAAMLATGGAAADRLSAVEERGTLTVAVYEDFGPYSCVGRQGRLVGADVALAEALAERMGLGLELVGFSAADTMDSDVEILRVTEEEEAPDLLMHAPVDPVMQDRNPDIHFFGAYFHESMAVLYNRAQLGNVPVVVDRPDPFDGARIGVEMYTLSYTFLTNGFDGRLREGTINHKSVPLAVEALTEGEVAAVMAPRGELQHALAALNGRIAADYGLSALTDLFRTDRVRSEWDVGVAAFGDHRELIQAVERTLGELRDDGTIEGIFAGHGIEWVAPGADAVERAYRGNGGVQLPRGQPDADQVCRRHAPAGLL